MTEITNGCLTPFKLKHFELRQFEALRELLDQSTSVMH